jgi:hypothetical protein
MLLEVVAVLLQQGISSYRCSESIPGCRLLVLLLKEDGGMSYCSSSKAEIKQEPSEIIGVMHIIFKIKYRSSESLRTQIYRTLAILILIYSGLMKPAHFVILAHTFHYHMQWLT